MGNLYESLTPRQRKEIARKVAIRRGGIRSGETKKKEKRGFTTKPPILHTEGMPRKPNEASNQGCLFRHSSKTTKSLAPRNSHVFAIVGIGACFVAWASLFIYKSSFVGIDGRRYFSLIDDAMISMR